MCRVCRAGKAAIDAQMEKLLDGAAIGSGLYRGNLTERDNWENCPKQRDCIKAGIKTHIRMHPAPRTNARLPCTRRVPHIYVCMYVCMYVSRAHMPMSAGLRATALIPIH